MEEELSCLTSYISSNKILGVGGFGFVMAVYDKRFKTDLAIKVITNKSKTKVLDSLKTEAKILESSNHKNIVKFRYFKEYSNCFVLAIEWCQEGSLIQWLKAKDDERLLLKEAVEKAEQKKIKSHLSLVKKKSKSD